MEEYLKLCLKLNPLYEVKYADYEGNQWTIPVKLTEDRMERILNDKSVTGLRLTFLNELI